MADEINDISNFESVNITYDAPIPSGETIISNDLNFNDTTRILTSILTTNTGRRITGSTGIPSGSTGADGMGGVLVLNKRIFSSVNYGLIELSTPQFMTSRGDLYVYEVDSVTYQVKKAGQKGQLHNTGIWYYTYSTDFDSILPNNAVLLLTTQEQTVGELPVASQVYAGWEASVEQLQVQGLFEVHAKVDDPVHSGHTLQFNFLVDEEPKSWSSALGLLVRRTTAEGMVAPTINANIYEQESQLVEPAIITIPISGDSDWWVEEGDGEGWHFTGNTAVNFQYSTIIPMSVVKVVKA